MKLEWTMGKIFLLFLTKIPANQQSPLSIISTCDSFDSDAYLWPQFWTVHSYSIIRNILVSSEIISWTNKLIFLQQSCKMISLFRQMTKESIKTSLCWNIISVAVAQVPQTLKRCFRSSIKEKKILPIKWVE